MATVLTVIYCKRNVGENDTDIRIFTSPFHSKLSSLKLQTFIFKVANISTAAEQGLRLHFWWWEVVLDPWQAQTLNTHHSLLHLV